MGESNQAGVKFRNTKKYFLAKVKERNKKAEIFWIFFRIIHTVNSAYIINKVEKKKRAVGRVKKRILDNLLRIYIS